MALSDKLIDKRILRRSLQKGEVDAGAYESYLADLPDLSQRIDRGSSAPEPEPTTSSPAAAPPAAPAAPGVGTGD